MSDTIPTGKLISMLRAAVEEIRSQHKLLTRLDTAIGDGDHGTAMLRSMDAVEKILDAKPDADPKDVFAEIGWGVMSSAGGSIGPLLGSFFIGMGAGLDGDSKELDAPALAAVIQSGVGHVRQHSKAQIGDKTMMDALLPAAEALENNQRTASPAELMKLAAAAASAGAEKTKDMRAKFGRARNLGARVLGHADPGATSMALILTAFSEALA